jgi:hypothetical protein
MRKPIIGAAAALASLLLAAGPLAGQGAGSVGLEVAQVPVGARAGALAGAYTGAWGDSDVVFYNPAALGGLGRAASLSYQRHVMDITFGSVAGAAQLGAITLGAGFAFMDGGEVPEIVPDPDFGGQRGRATGATLSARESTFRLAAAAPLLGDRVRAGAAVGFAMSELAGLSRSAAFVDVGAQLRLGGRGAVGVALRNAGGSLTGDGAEPTDLPLEARLGAHYLIPLPSDLGVTLAADLIQRPGEETTNFAGGFEFGRMPAEGGIGAVLRVGYRAEDVLPSASALQLGAGVTLANVSLDYQYQDLEFFGTAHRIGIRWRGR